MAMTRMTFLIANTGSEIYELWVQAQVRGKTPHVIWGQMDGYQKAVNVAPTKTVVTKNICTNATD